MATSGRERIKTVLGHRIPDRVPLDMGAAPCTGIAAIAYNKLRNALGVGGSGLARMYDIKQGLAYPEKEVRDRFHIDTIDAGQGFLKDEHDWKEWTLNDGSKCLIPKFINLEVDTGQNALLKDEHGLTLGIKPRSSFYFDQVYWVYGDMQKIPDNFRADEIRKNMWAIPIPPGHLDIHKDNDRKEILDCLRALHENTDYAVMYPVGCNLFEEGTWLRGMENFLVDIQTDAAGVERLFDHLTEGYLEILKQIIETIGSYIDILMVADDLGSQNNSLLSPEAFRKLLKPRYRKMYDYIHSHSTCGIFLHSCGSISNLLPDLIDIGLDIINPVQTTAAAMEPEVLKREFGRDIVFWGGGSNTRDILPCGTPQEIREDVKRRIDILGRDGGFVFNPIHNIMTDVPPENVIAMYDAAYEFGQYHRGVES